MTQETETRTVTRAPVPELERSDFVDALFGLNFPLQLEPYVFAVASELSSEYRGGYWYFYSLDNGGFYLAPNDDDPVRVCCPNGYEGMLSADALGITACMYAYSRLSFVADEGIARVYARHYHLLREYAMGHSEVAEILRATD